MNLEKIQEIESTNIKNWKTFKKTNITEKNFFEFMMNYLHAHAIMAITPIALETLSGKTLLLNFYDIIINTIIIPCMCVAILFFLTLNFLAYFTNDFKRALTSLLAVPLLLIAASLYIASNFIITAASFVTRPVSTLYYLASVLGSFFSKDEVLDEGIYHQHNAKTLNIS
jgi:hypothetical protein